MRCSGLAISILFREAREMRDHKKSLFNEMLLRGTEIELAGPMLHTSAS